ncbi:hypothetical protein F2Q70_00036504 [Brassica cretica]|uniref:Uncharacterized protein n=1 Tax=Brassica cretica TaxID=69181 RepID=A0A8S9JR12_BRACR|nr:hypothetical protein F2Q70_00036504 [Brassica cretica]
MTKTKPFNTVFTKPTPVTWCCCDCQREAKSFYVFVDTHETVLTQDKEIGTAIQASPFTYHDIRIELGKYRLQQEPHGLDNDGI